MTPVSTLTESILMRSIDTDVMKPAVLVSTNQIQQQQEPIIIDLESESTSVFPFMSSPIHVNNNCQKNKDQITHSVSPEPSSMKKMKHRAAGYLPQWEKEPETYYRTMTMDSLGELQESRQCWLRQKEDENGKITISCFLCK